MGKKDRYSEDSENMENSEEIQSDASCNVEHAPPPVIWYSFDAFYNNYCKKSGASLKWKNAVKLHIEKLGWMGDQNKWEDGCKHFGC